MSNNTYTFTLVLGGVNEKTEGLEDALFEAGCDDALVHFRNGTVYLDFDREVSNLEKAVVSAIRAVESAPIAIEVVSVAPDDYVSESEMAKRLHVKRQAVSLWVKGARRSLHAFPAPVLKLTERSPLWRWHEVAEWLYRQKKINNVEILENARFIEHINFVLVERDKSKKPHRRRISKKLKEG